MRLVKFLSEEILTKESIEQLCPKTAFKVDLFRGVKGLRGNIGKVIPTKHRSPTGCSSEMHALLNVAFKKEFGEAVRAEAVFCTGNKSEARDYGTLYKIYPSDDFSVYWSNSIEDLYCLQSTQGFLQIDEFAPFIAIYCLISEKAETRKAYALEYMVDR